MKTDITTVSFEIAQVSREHVLGVMFPKSRANAYPAVVSICRGADRYWQAEADGLLHHFAAFGKTPEQISRALAVANYANTMTAARFYARGLPLVDTQRLYESLKCYVKSLSCNDPSAHCVRVVRSSEDKQDYFVPCSLIAARWPTWKISLLHPASAADQMQAMAVESGCDWCPNFDAAGLKPVDVSGRLDHHQPNVVEWPTSSAKDGV